MADQDGSYRPETPTNQTNYSLIYPDTDASQPHSPDSLTVQNPYQEHSNIPFTSELLPFSHYLHRDAIPQLLRPAGPLNLYPPQEYVDPRLITNFAGNTSIVSPDIPTPPSEYVDESLSALLDAFDSAYSNADMEAILGGAEFDSEWLDRPQPPGHTEPANAMNLTTPNSQTTPQSYTIPSALPSSPKTMTTSSSPQTPSVNSTPTTEDPSTNTSPSQHTPQTTTTTQHPSPSHQLTCPTCPKTFSLRCELSRHQKTHTRPYICTSPDCSARYGSQRDLNRHRKWHRRKELGDQAVELFFGPVEGCGHRDMRRDNLRRHVGKHLR